MPKQTNSFIKGKMNKDLDPRVVPVGEYLDAENIMVAQSETGDVGSVEGLKDNLDVTTGTLAGSDYGYVIGYCLDSENDKVYYFVTKFSSMGSTTLKGSGGSTEPLSSDNAAIIEHNLFNNTTTVLLKSQYLNFDQHYPITGCNIIDGYLFFTDNKNQPRVFNVNDAASYLTTNILEDQLSVAKYAPVCAPKLLQPKYVLLVNGAVGAKAIVNGAVSNSTNVALDGNLTGTTIATGMTVTGTGITGTVTVQTVTSQAAIVLSTAVTLADNTILTFGSTNVTITTANSDLQTEIGNGVQFKVLDGTKSHLQDVLNFGTPGQDPPQPYGSNPQTFPDDIAVSSLSGTALVLNKPVTISDGTKLTLLCSSMVDNSANDSAIDTEFLKEKFARFSYRFKYKDNTYSIMAPFSQIAFVPAIDTFTSQLQEDAYEQAEVATFVNSINQLELKIDLPYDSPEFYLHIKEVEILMKESDSIAVKVVDTIKVDRSAISTFNVNSNPTGLKHTMGSGANLTPLSFGKVGTKKLQAYIHDIYKRRHELYYVYRSEDPYKVLPENQTTRVFDNVPNKALAQELISNRVVYGNFTQGKEIPTNLDFKLTVGNKTEDDEFTYGEYKRHTLKQNRTYSVGIVLADRYGRQSPVLLSKEHSSSILNKKAELGSEVGKCLKVVFNDKITTNLYDVETNPLGWYSYRIVVKQKQQDYYNVYTPGVTFYERDTNGDNYSYFALFGDNINKIPRDEITEGAANIAMKLATSSVDLDDIVENGNNALQTGSRSVIAIAALDDFIKTTADQAAFYEEEKDYLHVQTKGDGYGISSGTNNLTNNSSIKGLAVFETKPFISKLDIFYETSTCGLISDLNAKIDASTGGAAPADLKLRDLATGNTDKNDFNESVADGTNILRLRVYDANGDELTVGGNDLSITVDSVTCNSLESRNAQTLRTSFSVVDESGVLKLKLAAAQEFLPSPNNIYDIEFVATSNSGSATFNKTVEVKNVVPTLAFATGVTCLSYTANTTGTLTTVNSTTNNKIEARNGSADTSHDETNLAGDMPAPGTSIYHYEKVSGDSRILVDRDGTIRIDPTTNGIGAHETNISFVLKVTDIGGDDGAGNFTATLTVPLCIDGASAIDVPSGSCSTPKYNYYDRCYGGQGSQDPGDLYKEYFIPSSLTYCSETGNCNTDHEDILSNHANVDTTTGGTTVTNWRANERFTDIYIGGKALVNGAITNGGNSNSSPLNVNGLSTGFVLVKDMKVAGTGIPANTVITDVNSQTQILLSNAVTVADNAELTFEEKDPVLSGTSQGPGSTGSLNYYIRPALHANDTPGFAGYKGASDSNFIVTIGTIDYEYIIGVSAHSGLEADPDNVYPGVRKLVKRSTINGITNTKFTGTVGS